jgi:hypothetical protein
MLETIEEEMSDLDFEVLRLGFGFLQAALTDSTLDPIHYSMGREATLRSRNADLPDPYPEKAVFGEHAQWTRGIRRVNPREFTTNPW